MQDLCPLPVPALVRTPRGRVYARLKYVLHHWAVRSETRAFAGFAVALWAGSLVVAARSEMRAFVEKRAAIAAFAAKRAAIAVRSVVVCLRAVAGFGYGLWVCCPFLWLCS